METTTSSDKTYFFYLEVNSTNYKNICSFIPYTLKYNGYKWKQLQSSSDCTSSSNYPITDNTDSSQKITFPSQYLTAFAVAKNVIEGTITQSPSHIPTALQAK